ncbi:uncharacterized protein V1513DRAFT_444229 [Lipomyces chichibuensis]|uniref:uncharacterized protein n=1 Tax=Lipomyces chichibuensis TaxID=1546026 RepID=UPI00334415BC
MMRISSFPVVTTGASFLLCLIIILSSPSSGFGGLWLYSISTDSLGSALPRLTPQSPARVGLPDSYAVGIWTYCSVTPDHIQCPRRPYLPPLFFFDLPLALLRDLFASSTKNADIQNNIFLPPGIYPVETPRTWIALTIPQLLSYATSLAYLIAFVACAVAFTILLRQDSRSKTRMLRRASSICAASLLLGAAVATALVCTLILKLNQEITLGYHVAQGNPRAVLALWVAAMCGILSNRAVLSNTRARYSVRQPGKWVFEQSTGPAKLRTSTSSSSGWLFSAFTVTARSTSNSSPGTPESVESSRSLLFMDVNGGHQMHGELV